MLSIMSSGITACVPRASEVFRFTSARLLLFPRGEDTYLAILRTSTPITAIRKYVCLYKRNVFVS